MLTVTEAACTQLEQIKEKAGAPGDVGIRILREEENLTMKLDVKQNDDEVIEHNEKPLILMDPRIAEAVASHTLDVEANRLVLK